MLVFDEFRQILSLTDYTDGNFKKLNFSLFSVMINALYTA